MTRADALTLVALTCLLIAVGGWMLLVATAPKQQGEKKAGMAADLPDLAERQRRVEINRQIAMGRLAEEVRRDKATDKRRDRHTDQWRMQA